MEEENFEGKSWFYGNLDDHLRWTYDEISLVDNLQKAVTEPFWEIFISNLKWKLPNHVQRQYQKVLEEKWLENFFEFHIYSTYFQKNRSCLLSDSNMDIYKIKNRRLIFSKLDGSQGWSKIIYMIEFILVNDEEISFDDD